MVPDPNLAGYSVRFELSSDAKYAQQSCCTVRYADIEKLILMLNKLAEINISNERFEYSEVQYEIGEFRVIAFNTGSGDVMAALTSGGVTVHLQSVTKLSLLRDLIAKAKSHLDRHKLN